MNRVKSFEARQMTSFERMDCLLHAECKLFDALSELESTEGGRLAAMVEGPDGHGLDQATRGREEIPMVRSTVEIPVRVLNVNNAPDPESPGARGVVTLEQDGPEGKGTFKVDLPAKSCCAVLLGAATLNIQQKVQDGQPHR